MNWRSEKSNACKDTQLVGGGNCDSTQSCISLKPRLIVGYCTASPQWKRGYYMRLTDSYPCPETSQLERLNKQTKKTPRAARWSTFHYKICIILWSRVIFVIRKYCTQSWCFTSGYKLITRVIRKWHISLQINSSSFAGCVLIGPPFSCPILYRARIQALTPSGVTNFLGAWVVRFCLYKEEKKALDDAKHL